MSGKRAKQLMEQARLKSLDGSVIKSHEYKRLKKSYNNPFYAQVVVWHPSKPGAKFIGREVLRRMTEKNKAA